MILGSETPVCHISVTQHALHEREKALRPHLSCVARPHPYLSATSQAPEVGSVPARCERSSSKGVVLLLPTLAVASHITVSICDIYFQNFFDFFTNATIPCLVPVTRFILRFVLMPTWPEPA